MFKFCRQGDATPGLPSNATSGSVEALAHVGRRAGRTEPASPEVGIRNNAVIERRRAVCKGEMT